MVFDRKKHDKKRTKKIRKFRNRFKRDGVCENCGSTEDLQFHHVNPAEKANDITRIKNFKDIRKEIKKTILLCKECHINTFRKK